MECGMGKKWLPMASFSVVCFFPKKEQALTGAFPAFRISISRVYSQVSKCEMITLQHFYW